MLLTVNDCLLKIVLNILDGFFGRISELPVYVWL